MDRLAKDARNKLLCRHVSLLCGWSALLAMPQNKLLLPRPLLNRYGSSHALLSSFVSSLGVVLCAAGGPIGERDIGAVS